MKPKKNTVVQRILKGGNALNGRMTAPKRLPIPMSKNKKGAYC